jgi:hypothetical protein
VAITVVLGYVLCLWVLARKSREIDKQIDYSRIRPWKDDEAKD